MVVVVFRIHVNPESNPEELGTVFHRMVALFGEMLVLAEFDSLDAVDAWKAHPEHALAQQRGQEFFADYRIQICNLVRTNESAKTLY